MPSSTNTHEAKARTVKALTLLRVIWSAGAKDRTPAKRKELADGIEEHWGESDWAFAAKVAQVRPPSEATKAVVLAMLRDDHTNGKARTA